MISAGDSDEIANWGPDQRPLTNDRMSDPTTTRAPVNGELPRDSDAPLTLRFSFLFTTESCGQPLTRLATAKSYISCFSPYADTAALHLHFFVMLLYCL